MLKQFVFYSVTASVIALMAQLAGANLPVILFFVVTNPPAYSIDYQNYALRFRGVNYGLSETGS